MTICLVPVKGLSNALERLASLLSPQERARLSLAMLRDVMEILQRVKGLDGLMVVSREPAVGDIARQVGARVVEEPEDLTGESAAVDYGSRLLAGEGVKRVLVVPSDIPLAEEGDIEIVLRLDLGTPSVVIAPSQDGGTNALLKSPPDVIPSRFGPDSLALHIREAEAKSVPYRVIRLPSLATDIDSLEDLLHLVNIPNATATGALVEELGLRERLLQQGYSVAG